MDPNDQKKTACYDIDVEVEDPLKSQMSSFLLSTANQQEIASLDNKVSQEYLRPLKVSETAHCMFSVQSHTDVMKLCKITTKKKNNNCSRLHRFSHLVELNLGAADV